MATYIRLTDYKSSDEKEQEFFNPENRYEAKQENFSKIVASPITYWVSEKKFQIFSNNKNLDFHGSLREGIHTGKNELFLRYWYEVKYEKFSYTEESIDDIDRHAKKWIPYNKGGSYRKWFGNNEYVICFDNKSRNEMLLLSGHVRPSQSLYFKSGGTWSALSSGNLGVRFYPNGYLFDSKGQVIVTTEALIQKISYMNSKVAKVFFDILMPTLDFKCGDVKKTPYIPSDDCNEKIETLTQQNIDISKEEWDSRETSWDFTKNELIKHKSDTKIETAYANFCNHWQEQHNTLHQNEEELNRLFIDIYELQDELTPDVELKDITILKNEAKIVDDELIFQADEIMKQFISYGVGVMFGRYSLDSDGLLIANMGQDVPTDTTFEIDDDNIIPVVDESDYFSDDITDRFVEFVRTTFGSEKLQQNIAFIEKAIGKKIRDYFMKEFYKDHVSTKRYKKRPIYWLFSSPKGTFQTLIYMHRYTPDTLNYILNDYLRPFRIRLDTMRNEAMRTTEREDVSSREKTDADKKIDKIDKTLDDINAYEKILAHYAAQRIEIDLDDGVKANYCKFKELLFEFDKKLCK